MTIAVAVWIAERVGLWMPTHVALIILVAASLAGMAGFGLAARRWAAKAR